MSKSAEWVLGVDIGTHGVRAALVNRSGRVSCCRSRPIALRRLDHNRIEQDPDEIVAATRQVIRLALKASGETPDSAGLAIQRSTVVAWDRASGRALSPALSWQDTRAAGRLNDLEPHRDAIKTRSGLVLSPHYGASKLAWLRENLNPPSSGGLCLSPLVAFVLFHLLEDGEALCDETNAGRTQLFNVRERRWDGTLCQWFDLPKNLLPSVKPTCHPYGVLAESGVPLEAVCGDQNAAFWALSGGGQQKSALVNAGSGAFVLAPFRGDPVDTGSLLIGVARSDKASVAYLLEGTVNGAGTALDWCCDTFGDGDKQRFYASLDDWLRRVSSPPVFVNGIGGLGSPWWQARLQSTFMPEESDLARRAVAVLESIVFLLCANLACIRRLVPDIEILTVTGGIGQSDGFCQRLADLSGLSVRRPDMSEATLLGVAAQAGDFLPSLDLGTLFEPERNPALAKRYQALMDRLPQPTSPVS